MNSVVSLGSVKSRGNLRLVLFDPSQGPLADGHDPVLRPFAFADEHRAPFEVDVVDVQVQEFDSANARRVERFENGAISQTERIVDVGHREHSFDFCDGEHVTRESAAKSWKLDLGRRIRQENVRRREPLEESLYGDQASVLRPERDRFSARPPRHPQSRP
jgi:hypothetical protein